MLRPKDAVGMLILLATAIAACGSDSAPARSQGDISDAGGTTATARAATAQLRDPKLLDTGWLLTSIGGRRSPREYQVTLHFYDSMLSGGSGCNEYSAGYTASGGVLRVTIDLDGPGEPMMSTAIDCMDSKLTSLEDSYQGILQGVVRYRVSGDRLQLLDTEGKAILAFDRIEPSPLDGTYWHLVSVDGKRVRRPEHDEPDLRFSANEARWYDGCNRFASRYTVTSNRIGIGRYWWQSNEICPRDASAAVPGYAKALSDAATYRVQGEQLEIHDAKGKRRLLFLTPEAARAAAAKEGPRGRVRVTFRLTLSGQIPKDEAITIDWTEVTAPGGTYVETFCGQGGAPACESGGTYSVTFGAGRDKRVHYGLGRLVGLPQPRGMILLADEWTNFTRDTIVKIHYKYDESKARVEAEEQRR